VNKLKAIQQKLRVPLMDKDEVSPLGTREILCNWIRDEDDCAAPMIEMQRYAKLLSLLPDKIVENLEKGRLSHDGRYPMLKAGLGYEEMLSSIIVDGTAITSSAAEAKLVPALKLPSNYLQPGGIPGRTLRHQLRGRVTTLVTTAGTMTFRIRSGTTDVITGATWAASGAITSDAVAQTNTMWEVEAHTVVRSVGSAGTVFTMGDTAMSSMALTIANAQAVFMGSAGSATPAAVTVDMTVDEFLQVTGQWSLSTAYSIQAHQYLLEALN
jgi:hypothetical protein